MKPARRSRDPRLKRQLLQEAEQNFAMSDNLGIELTALDSADSQEDRQDDLDEFFESEHSHTEGDFE